jgi:hypothetical protein
VSKRIDDLIDRLTLDERFAMLHQYAPAVPRLGIASFRTGSEALHGVSWLGVATVFPQTVGLAPAGTWTWCARSPTRSRPNCGPQTRTPKAGCLWCWGLITAHRARTKEPAR